MIKKGIEDIMDIKIKFLKLLLKINQLKIIRKPVSLFSVANAQVIIKIILLLRLLAQRAVLQKNKSKIEKEYSPSLC